MLVSELIKLIEADPDLSIKVSVRNNGFEESRLITHVEYREIIDLDQEVSNHAVLYIHTKKEQ